LVLRLRPARIIDQGPPYHVHRDRDLRAHVGVRGRHIP
jgi:hypothetical protein